MEKVPTTRRRSTGKAPNWNLDFRVYVCTCTWVYQYYKLDRCESVCVCVSVTDVTSLPQRVLWERGYNVYRNAYAGNESPS